MSETAIKTDLVTMLGAHAGLTALVSERVYASKAPQGVTMPYVVLHDVGGEDEHCHDGLRVSSFRLQFDAVAVTAAEVTAVMDALDAALSPDLQPRTVGSTRFDAILRQGAGTSSRDEVEHAQGVGRERKTVDYRFRVS